MSDSGAANAHGPTGRLVKNFREMVSSLPFTCTLRSRLIRLHFATPTSMSYMEAECANMVPFIGMEYIPPPSSPYEEILS